jgi:ribosomal-protein-alanine N-acetyltransferase
MLEWMAQQSRDHGARTMLLEVRPSNRPAQQLYERYGFERIGIRRGYYPAHGGREDALVMRIAL